MNTQLEADITELCTFEQLLRIALDATSEALRVCGHAPMLNERYLHHFMSHMLQAESPNLRCLGNTSGEPLLHPEWPTWKKSTGITCGQYSADEQKRYVPKSLSERGAGFIDFALGTYGTPTVGIEVTLKDGWSHEEIVYDFVKLLDARNRTFKAVISCNIIRREKGVSRAKGKDNLQNRMQESYTEAQNRLGDLFCDDDRQRFLCITEVAPDDRRHWYFDTTTNDFIESIGLPPILHS